jgi:hypothetical protein
MKIKLRWILIILLVSITFTLLSFSYQRFGPEVGYLGADCRPDCEVLKLNAGWPLPFVFDSMGVSVINVLHLEDEFRPTPFIIDIGFYTVILMITYISVERIRIIKGRQK